MDKQLEKQVDFRTIRKPNKKQKGFMYSFLTPKSKTFGNVYQSAIANGFSDNYARQMSAKSKGVEWIQELKALYTHLEPEHIYLGMQQIALEGQHERDKLRALELMAKIKGMFVDRSEVQHNVVFTNSVPRPQSHSEGITEAEVIDIPPEGSK